MCASEPVFPCSCAWNLPVQQGLFGAEGSGGDGKMEAQIKTTPTGALTPNAGALPTVKESTDA